MKAIGFTSLAMAMHVGDWDGAQLLSNPEYNLVFSMNVCTLDEFDSGQNYNVSNLSNQLLIFR